MIAIWNGNTKADPYARIKELAPEKVLRGGVKVIVSDVIPVTVDQLYGDQYLNEIFSVIVPQLVDLLEVETTPEKTAMIGSSMGGQEAICRRFWSPIIDDAITDADSRDFTWDAANLEILRRQ